MSYRDDPDRDKGIYEKYHVARLNDEAGKHNECEYFILDLVHDDHARAALLAYAISCKDEYPVLSAELMAKCGFGSGAATDTSGS